MSTGDGLVAEVCGREVTLWHVRPSRRGLRRIAGIWRWSRRRRRLVPYDGRRCPWLSPAWSLPAAERAWASSQRTAGLAGQRPAAVARG